MTRAVVAFLPAIILSLCACAGGGGTETKKPTDDVFPLAVTDNLPSENRLRVNPDAVRLADESKAFSINLPNNLVLIIKPVFGETTGRVIDFGENAAFVKNPRGKMTPIANGWGFGDFEKTLIVDKDAKRVYIQESIWDKPEYIIREHDLKCAKNECAFFTRDCLFKAEIPTENMEQELSELSAKWNQVDAKDNLAAHAVGKEQSDYMKKMFISAMSGEKKLVMLLLDKRRIDKYFRSGPSYNVSLYPEIYQNLLVEYGKKCFADKTIKWPEE